MCTKSDCRCHYFSSSEDESWQGDFEDDASSWASPSEYNIDQLRDLAEAAEDSRASLEAMKVEALFSLAFHQHKMRASEDKDEGEQVMVSSLNAKT